MSHTDTISSDGGSTFRGRNGWAVFAGADLFINIPRGMVTVDVFSKKVGHTAPVVLRLTPDDARNLACALLDAAAEATLDNSQVEV